MCMQNLCVLQCGGMILDQSNFPRSNTVLPPAKDELNKGYREIELICENVCFKQEP